MNDNAKYNNGQVTRVSEYDAGGGCWSNGQQFEILLYDMFETRGYQVSRSSRDEDIFLHADMWLAHYDESYGLEWLSVDAKALKRVARSDDDASDKYTWVEWRNVKGRDGWLLDGADLIAFERLETVQIVRREELLSYCMATVSSHHVNSSRDALYHRYSRQGRSDEISLIDLDQVTFGYTWNKRLRLEDVLDQVAIALSELSAIDKQDLIERLFRECRAHHD